MEMNEAWIRRSRGKLKVPSLPIKEPKRRPLSSWGSHGTFMNPTASSRYREEDSTADEESARSNSQLGSHRKLRSSWMSLIRKPTKSIDAKKQNKVKRRPYHNEYLRLQRIESQKYQKLRGKTRIARTELMSDLGNNKVEKAIEKLNEKVSMELPVVNPYVGCFANTRVKLLDLLT